MQTHISRIALHQSTMPSTDDHAAAQPLLGSSGTPASSRLEACRRATKAFMDTKAKHFFAMALVALDVGVVLADVFVALVACDTGAKDDARVEATQEALHLAQLIFSAMFLVELLATVWAFGPSFFDQWFHCFDAFVIVGSFLIDVLSHGVFEDLGSLVIILRLWRLVKVVDEMTSGAEERMEEMTTKLDDLEKQNSALLAQLQERRARGDL